MSCALLAARRIDAAGEALHTTGSVRWSTAAREKRHPLGAAPEEPGSANGTRTRVAALKGRSLNHLTMAPVSDGGNTKYSIAGRYFVSLQHAPGRVNQAAAAIEAPFQIR